MTLRARAASAAAAASAPYGLPVVDASPLPAVVALAGTCVLALGASGTEGFFGQPASSTAAASSRVIDTIFFMTVSILMFRYTFRKAPRRVPALHLRTMSGAAARCHQRCTARGHPGRDRG